jgi:hypothetical protein
MALGDFLLVLWGLFRRLFIPHVLFGTFILYVLPFFLVLLSYVPHALASFDNDNDR